MNKQEIEIWRDLDEGYANKEEKEAFLNYVRSKEAAELDVEMKRYTREIEKAIERAFIATGATIK